MNSRDLSKASDLSADEQEILEYWLQREQQVPRRRERDEAPLSFGQQRLWFLHQFESGNPMHHLSLHLRLQGELQREALQASLREIVRRHEVLRTTFCERDDKTVQVVAPAGGMAMPVVDLSGLDKESLGTEISRRIKKISTELFDLSTGPLLRGELVKLGPDDHLMLLTMHHIVSDTWSLGVLMRELGLLYGAYIAHEPSPLRELPIQYADFAAWERERLQGEALERQLGYWRRQLTGLSTLQLPADYPRPAIQTFSGARESRALPKAVCERLKAFAKSEDITLFITLLSGIGVLFRRYTRQDDIVVGSPIANRNRTELEGLIGFFTNTIVLRMDLTGDPSFRELVKRVRKTTLDAYAHQDLPFEKLVDELKPSRDLSRSPLFQVLFVLLPDTGESAAPISAAGLTVGSVPVSTVAKEASQVDLEFLVSEGRQGLSVECVYNPDLFEAGSIRRMLGHYERLLENVADNPNGPVGGLDIFTESERYQLLEGWNETSSAYPRDCVHRLFEAQVERSPESLAVEAEDGALTYFELDARSNQLAGYLRELGVKPGVLVGICVDRTLDMVVSALGVMKAGGAYVPLDPSFPGERLAFMVEDAGIAVLVTQGRLSVELPVKDVRVVDLDAEREALEARSRETLDGGAGLGDLVYVIYTSGSTGRPKGVCIEHRALTNFLWSMKERPGFTTDNLLLAVTTLSFDISGLELYLPLIVGGRVVLASGEAAMDGNALSRAMETSGATVMQATPATWQLLLSSGWQGRAGLKVLCGGEALPPELATSLRKRCDSLWNLYGPTETTIWSTVEEVQDESIGGSISIGRPIANTRIYILDDSLEPVPVGVPGELYIGGEGLARGYWNRPELTAERFVADPFVQVPEARMYRTGDVARWRADGRLECLGRSDHQVKLRGYRIELGEIERVLEGQASVDRAVVVCREDTPGDKRLVAYMTSAAGVRLSAPALKGYLQRALPQYMVPSAFVELEAVPLTPNGKVDRKALPAPEGERQVEEGYVAPRSEVEETLAEIWAEVLRLDRVGVHDNFFDLGGHSLLMLKVRARLEESLGVEVAAVMLFQYPTIDSLAAHLSGELEERRLLEEARARVGRRKRVEGRSDAIAIVGMAGRFPGAPDLERFWSNLREGVESIRFFSEEELRAAGVDERLLSDPSYVQARSMLGDAELFDASFFGYAPREAELLDPQQRLFLECAWEALECAGYDSTRYKGLIGVYAGSAINSYFFKVLSRPDLLEGGGGGGALTGIIDNDYLPMRVSYKLDLRGPSVNVQTTCSTSLVAVHEACRSLAAYECDLALAGGVSVTGDRVTGYVYQKDGIVSPDGHCRAFDAAAQGTVFGEGVGIVVLKRLAEALEDGDTIHAVVLGTAINNDGSKKVGFTAPSVEAQAEAIALAQAEAGVHPDTISYVEAHGTGTALGDPIEMVALNRVFGNSEQHPCALGTVKSNVGHLDRAAGIAGLIKTVLALGHRQIPASLHYSVPNPEINFEASRFYVNTELKEWQSKEEWPRRAGVSSFGMGGTNAHAILEEAPAVAESAPSRKWQLLVLSAKTARALEAMSERLAAHLEAHPELALADVAYTLQVGRRGFGHRIALVCRSAEEAVAALRAAVAQRGRAAEQAPEVVFMFPGQGAQHVGMGAELYREEAVFREAVDACCERLEPRLGLDLRTVLYPEEEQAEASAERLKQTALTQPALFVLEYALAQLWMAWGIRPAAMIGHSIGEYVAACLSGVMTLEDALGVVAERGRLMQGMPAGAMLAVTLAEEELRGMLDERVSIAGVNGPELCVVSGPHEAIDELARSLTEQEREPRRLHISHAFHSPMMEPVIEAFAQYLRGIELNAPKLPYVSNVSGDWITAEQATDPEYYARQLRATVRFSEGLETLFTDEGRVLLEVGPGRTLTGLSGGHPKRPAASTAVASLPAVTEEHSDAEAVFEALGRLWVAGVEPEWSAIHGDGGRHRVELPTYPFERRRYWIDARPMDASQSPGFPTAMVVKANKVEDWCYVPVWKSSLTFDVEARDDWSLKGAWLVFTEEGGFSELIASGIERRGGEVIRVGGAEVFTRRSDGKYLINPACREDYERLLEVAEFGDSAPRRIVHAWSLGAAQDNETDRALERSFYSILFLTQAIVKRWPGARMHVDVLTEGAVCVGTGDTPVPERATALGLCNVIPQELPSVSCRSIDLALSKGSSADDEGLVRRLLGELGGVSSTPVVAYRNHRRWVQTFEKIPVREHAGKHRLRQHGAYLITGGIGGVGLALAAHLAKTVKARLILTHRSKLPHRNAWEQWLSNHDDNDRTSHKIRGVLALEDLGAEVMLATVDVASRADMHRLVTAATERFGAIHGVIHAAGVMGGPSFRSIEELTPEDCELQFHPKLRGLLVLQELFHDRPLDFIMPISSLSSVLGGLRFAAYAAANRFMDALCNTQYAQGDERWLSVNWDAWRFEEKDAKSAVGSSVAALALTPREGREAFDLVMRLAMLPQVLVSTGDLSARLAQWVIPQSPAEAGDVVPEHRHERPSLSTELVAPANEIEQAIAAIWQDLFNIEKIGSRDNFFDLGGHSLLALQAAARVRDRFDIGLTLDEFLELGTIEKIAANLEAKRWAARRKRSVQPHVEERDEFDV